MVFVLWHQEGISIDVFSDLRNFFRLALAFKSLIETGFFFSFGGNQNYRAFALKPKP